MFKAKLFGPPSFFDNSREIFLPSRKAMALLCYLLIENRVSREKAAGLLWCEKDEETAHKNLRNTLYVLKKHIPEGIVLSDRQWIFIDPKNKLETDLDLLRNLDAASTDDCIALAQPFLDGLYVKDCPIFDEWLNQTRYIYEEQAALALKEKTKRLYSLGLYQEGIKIIQAYYAKNKLDEEACYLLMLGHKEEENTGKIQELFHELKDNLKKELDTYPREKTRKLFEETLTIENSPIETKPYKPNSSKRDDSDWFYGRDRELDEIASFMEEQPPHISRCLLVVGEAGVGKSRLIEKYLEDKCDDTVIYGRGTEEGKELVLLPFNDLAKNLALKFDLKDLGPMLPEKVKMILGEAFPPLNMGVSFEFPGHDKIGSTLAEFFRILSSKRPLKVVFEDLQWFDSASLTVLENFLKSNPGRTDIFITSRPDMDRKIEKSINALNRIGLIKAKTIKLESFSFEEVRQFFHMALGNKNLCDQTIQKVYEYSSGLPLYLKSYIALIQQGKPLDEIPDTIKEAIERILAGLSDEERQILECMSVFLNDADWELLIQICDCDEESLTSTAESLYRKGIIREYSPGPRGHLLLGFKHGKVKEFVERGLSEARRRTLHQKLANVIKKSWNTEVWKHFEGSRLLFHCRKAGILLDELSFALKSLEFHTKLNYELFPLLDDQSLIQSSAAYEEIGETKKRFLEVKELLGKVREKYGETHECRKLEMIYRMLLGGYMVWWGDHQKGGNLLKSALEWSALKNEKALELKCLQNLCYLHIQTEESQALDLAAERYLHTAEENFDEAAYGAALRFKGLAATFMANFDKAMEYLDMSEKHFEDLEAAGAFFTLQKEAARKYKGEVYHKRGLLDEAVKNFTQCLQNAESRGIHRGSFSFHSNLAHVFFDMKDLPSSNKHVEEALNFAEERTWWRGNSVVYSIKAMLCFIEGNENDALEYLKKADELCKKLNKKCWIALQLKIKGMMAREKPISKKLREYLTKPPEDYLTKAQNLYDSMGIKFLQ